LALEDITPRIALLIFVGVAITILAIMSCTDIWKHEYEEGLLFLASAAVLAFLFFRKRMIALTIVGLSFVLVSAGVTAIFHPSLFGILLTIGSAGAAYFIAMWDFRRRPNYTSKDWKTLFDNRSKV
jgi:hypothetical protein